MHTKSYQFLIDRFPACFKLKSHERQPLQVGIRDHILKLGIDGVTPVKLRRALWAYTHNPGYLWNMTEGRQRIDLDGNPAGAVTTPEAAHAKDQLEYLKARREAALQTVREAA